VRPEVEEKVRIADIWITKEVFAATMYHKWGKRAMDIILAAVLLLLCLPLLLVTALLLAWLNKGKIFFRQLRPGRHRRSFHIYKFRTMTDERDAAGHLLSDQDRLTWFGKFIRATSIDELPQLFNVLRGDLSLVGPRPLLMEYLPLYSPEQDRRHEVRPGITGWAQVNGRNTLSWGQKFAFDVWYVHHLSLGLDLKILGLTLLRVIGARDINAPGSATAEKFRGNPPDAVAENET
jgi:lipopolysaccharide/colanic/teichoic acid biosynthesis glycosyltransferase